MSAGGTIDGLDVLDVLVEVGVEELPDRFVAGALRQLEERARTTLDELHLRFEAVHTHGTPRRLALLVDGLQARQEDRSERVVGPPVKAAYRDGEPTKAATGFAAKMGVDVSELETVDDPKGERVAAVRHVPGRAAAEVVADDLVEVFRSMHWGKTMRWGRGEHQWVRPVHWLVALAGEEVVAAELFGVRSGRVSRGHRTRHPAEVEIPSAAGYLDALREAGVVASREERRRMIEEGLARGAKELGGELVADPGLLETTVDLVERPCVLVGHLPERYLELPDIVLSTALRVHQRCFVATDSEGRLMAAFLHVANQEDPDGRIAANNGSVIAARLDDAVFFREVDRKNPLTGRVADLGRVQYHARLGTYLEKVERMSALAREVLALEGEGADDDASRDLMRAVELCKVDQTSEMVAELTELEGLVGGLYLREEGEAESVCAAVEEHYLPQSLTDPAPATRLGALLAVIDKADTLVGSFGVGMQPTGSKDPFGLRRAAQGLVRTLLESPIDVPVDALLTAAREVFAGRGETRGFDGDRIEADLLPFLEQRTRFLLSEGARYAPGGTRFPADEVAACMGAGWTRLRDLRARVGALHAVRSAGAGDDFEALSVAFKRVRNIVRDQPRGELTPEALVEPPEKDLADRLSVVAAEVARHREAGEHEKALEAIASLRPQVDRFFDEVLVMAEDEALRANRVALLQRVEDLFLTEADLSQVVAGGGD